MRILEVLNSLYPELRVLSVAANTVVFGMRYAGNDGTYVVYEDTTSGRLICREVLTERNSRGGRYRAIMVGVESRLPVAQVTHDSEDLQLRLDSITLSG